MSNYKFPDIQKEIADASLQKDLIKNKRNNINLNKDPNIISGSVFDINAFNKKLNNVYSMYKQEEDIENKIRKLKEVSSIPDPNRMTLNKFKIGILLDTYDMFYELFYTRDYTIPNIKKIMNKNYRKITFFILLLLLFVLFFVFVSIKSYLF
jgi:DNA repair exonuclease SbcCD ATPase subunit